MKSHSPARVRLVSAEATLPGGPVALRRQVAVPPLRRGDFVGQARLLTLLGEGGMGQVWAAWASGAPVAVKVAKLGSTGAQRAIAAEARALGAIRSPHLPGLFAEHADAARPHVVMELLSGTDLQTRLREHGALTVEQVVEILAQLFAALDDVHSAGFVHGDVKPANLMVDAQGHVTLIDYGLAFGPSAPRDWNGRIQGTPPYMAPEFVTATASVSAAADIYAAGCTAYALVTGAPPFSGSTEAEIFAGHLYDSPPAINIGSTFLAKIISRCLAKNPAERPSALVLCRALQALCHDSGTCSVAA